MSLLKKIEEAIYKRKERIAEKAQQKNLQNDMQKLYEDFCESTDTDGIKRLTYDSYTNEQGHSVVCAFASDGPIIRKVQNIYSSNGNVVDVKKEYLGYIDSKEGTRDFVRVIVTNRTSSNPTIRTTRFVTAYDILARRPDGSIYDLSDFESRDFGEHEEESVESKFGKGLVERFEKEIEQTKETSVQREL